MQTIRKFKQSLVGALALAIPLAVSAAPVTLRFAGEMQAAWPGAPVGTPFVVSYTFDPAQLVDESPDPSEGLYSISGGAPFGTVSFTAGSLVLPGYLSAIYIKDNAPGQDDMFQIYAVIADAANNGSTAWIFASGKDWLSGDSLPLLNAAFFDGASSLVLEATTNSPEPNPLQAFPGPAGVRALPEPGSLAPVGLALAAVAGSRRGRART